MVKNTIQISYREEVKVFEGRNFLNAEMQRSKETEMRRGRKFLNKEAERRRSKVSKVFIVIKKHRSKISIFYFSDKNLICNCYKNFKK